MARFQVTVSAIVETDGKELMREDVEGILLGASARDIGAVVVVFDQAEVEIEEED
jgi:hypothetical protein